MERSAGERVSQSHADMSAEVTKTATKTSDTPASLVPDPDQDVVFHHRWSGRAELTALGAIVEALAAQGLRLQSQLIDDTDPQPLLQRTQAADRKLLAMKMHGEELRAWGQSGALADLGGIVDASGWRAALPEVLRPFMINGGQLHGVPLGMHRSNWSWANAAVFERAGIDPPSSWEEFNEAAGKLQSMDVIPLALGGQDWQEATLFESVALGIGGPAFYRAALVENDAAALGSEVMLAVFKQMRLLSGMVDPAYDQRSWSATTALVTRGAAAMQIMGEWVKGEFLSAGMAPQRDFLCLPAPGTQGSYLFLSDFFGILQLRAASGRDTLAALVDTVMSKQVQLQFNLAKGSIPARLDIDGTGMDACAQAGIQDRREAIANGTMLGSLTYQHATTDAIKHAVLAVVHAHFHAPMSEASAIRLLADQIAAAKRIA